MALDAETPQSAKPATEISLQDMQRLARTDSDGKEKLVLSLHDRFVARVLAPPVAWLALKLGLSADVVTFFSIVVGLAGAGGFVLGTAESALIGVVLLQFSYLLDCADGDIARARG